MNNPEILSAFNLIHNYTPLEILINFTVSILLSYLVFMVYKKTFTGVLYSRSFNLTIMLITLVTTMVIMIISGNLVLSLGMVGALSIIRFRSAIKDPRDIGFLFWGISIGLACGTSYYLVAIIGSIIISAFLLISNRTVYDDSAYLLVLKGEALDYDSILELVKKETARYKVRMRNTLGSKQEAIFEVKIKNDGNTLVESLEQVSGVEAVHMVTYNGEINQ